jgi:hypothetical protein
LWKFITNIATRLISMCLIAMWLKIPPPIQQKNACHSQYIRILWFLNDCSCGHLIEPYVWSFYHNLGTCKVFRQCELFHELSSQTSFYHKVCKQSLQYSHVQNLYASSYLISFQSFWHKNHRKIPFLLMHTSNMLLLFSFW